jgi:predicted TIM-barrel fold metal-dependent hydrolase
MEFFDAHVAIGPRRVVFQNQCPTAREVIERLEECGIREALVYHTTSVEDSPVYGNARLLEEIREIPNIRPAWALLPFGTSETGTPDEVRRRLRDNAIKAVLLYPAEHGYANAEWCCGDLYSMLEQMRMPVFTRAGGVDFSWNELHELLANHPGIPVILRSAANTGYQMDRSLYPLLEKFTNLHVETARYLVFSGIEEIVRRFGAERMVFGSEAPLFSPGAAVTTILTSALAQRDKELVARGNLLRLIGGIDYGA